MTQADKPSWSALTQEQKISVLKEYWLGGGMSASEIAAMYRGATKNAIIGSVHRAKLHRGRVVPAKPGGKASAPRNNTPRPKAAPRSAADVPDDAALSPSKIWELIGSNREPLAGLEPVSILDLPNREGGVCRFPVVGGYCGAAVLVDGRPYCVEHYAVAYKPVPPRAKKAEA